MLLVFSLPEAASVPSPDRRGSPDGRHPALTALPPRHATPQWGQRCPGVPGAPPDLTGPGGLLPPPDLAASATLG